MFVKRFSRIKTGRRSNRLIIRPKCSPASAPRPCATPSAPSKTGSSETSINATKHYQIVEFLSDHAGMYKRYQDHPELDDGDWEKDGAASVGEIMGEVECSKRTIEKGDKVSEKVLDDVVMMLGCCADDIQGEKITDAR